MSVKIIGWVWDNSQVRHTTLLVALALADHAHHDGNGAYPSIRSIADKARCSERQAQRAIRDLVRFGELTVSYGGGPNGANVYSFTLAGVTPTSPRQIDTLTNRTQRGDKSYTEGVTPTSPKPSLRTVLEPSEIKELPRWASILKADIRTGDKFNDPSFIADIEASFKSLDLTIEAQKCLSWLQSSTKGKTRKDIAATWLNWLSNAKNRPQSNGHQPHMPINNMDIYKAEAARYNDA